MLLFDISYLTFSYFGIFSQYTAVQKVMPALIERHRSDVSAIEQLRRERSNESGKDFIRRDGAETGKDMARRDGGTGSDSDENGLEDNSEVSTPSNGERQKRIMAPRKKFEWTHQLRYTLVIRIKCAILL